MLETNLMALGSCKYVLYIHSTALFLIVFKFLSYHRRVCFHISLSRGGICFWYQQFNTPISVIRLSTLNNSVVIACSNNYIVL